MKQEDYDLIALEIGKNAAAWLAETNEIEPFRTFAARLTNTFIEHDRRFDHERFIERALPMLDSEEKLEVSGEEIREATGGGWMRRES